MSVHPASARESDRPVAWTDKGGSAEAVPSSLRVNDDISQDGKANGSEEAESQTPLVPLVPLVPLTPLATLAPIERANMRPRDGERARVTPSSPPPPSPPRRGSSGSPSPSNRARVLSAEFSSALKNISAGRRRSSVTAAVRFVARSTKTILERAFHFAGHSIFNTALISVIGVLVVELPLCVTLKAMAEKLAAPVGDDNSPTLTNLALNATNATDVQSLTWRPRSLIWPGDWRADGNEQYFAAVEDSDPVGLLAPYWSIQALVASCPYMMSMWLVAMSMYGWGVKIRRALVVTMLTSCVYVMGDAINAVWTGSDRGYAYSPMYCFLDFGVSYTVVVVDNCCKFLYPSPKAWSSVIRPFLGVVTIIAVGDRVLKSVFLPVYFSVDADAQITRVLIRGCGLPMFKYIWVHTVLEALESFGPKHKEKIFLGLVMPLALVTTVGHSMQLAASSIGEAAAMEAMTCAMEVFEYFTYLRGDTHITKSWRKFIWFKEKIEHGSFHGSFSAAQVSAAQVGDGSDTSERRVSVEVSERSLAATAQADEERVQRKKDRIRTMTSVSVSLGIIEGTSSTMTSSLFLMLPLNPSVIGGLPIPADYVVKLWAVQMLFELVIPEIILAAISQKLSESQRGRFGDMTEALRDFGLKEMAVVAFIAVTSIAMMHSHFLGALCLAPADADGGGGLLSFSACCADPLECWMEDHYPATCGEMKYWSWGERCEPEPLGKAQLH